MKFQVCFVHATTRIDHKNQMMEVGINHEHYYQYSPSASVPDYLLFPPLFHFSTYKPLLIGISETLSPLNRLLALPLLAVGSVEIDGECEDNANN